MYVPSVLSSSSPSSSFSSFESKPVVMHIKPAETDFAARSARVGSLLNTEILPASEHIKRFQARRPVMQQTFTAGEYLHGLARPVKQVAIPQAERLPDAVNQQFQSLASQLKMAQVVNRSAAEKFEQLETQQILDARRKAQDQARIAKLVAALIKKDCLLAEKNQEIKCLRELVAIQHSFLRR